MKAQSTMTKQDILSLAHQICNLSDAGREAVLHNLKRKRLEDCEEGSRGDGGDGDGDGVVKRDEDVRDEDVKREKDVKRHEDVNENGPKYLVMRQRNIDGEGTGVFYASFSDLDSSFSDWKNLVGSVPSDRGEGLDPFVYDDILNEWDVVHPWEQMKETNIVSMDDKLFDFTRKHWCVVVEAYSDE